LVVIIIININITLSGLQQQLRDYAQSPMTGNRKPLVNKAAGSTVAFTAKMD